jgi:uncharacterized membrane protein
VVSPFARLFPGAARSPDVGLATLAALGAEAAGVVLLVQELAGSHWLAPFIARNELASGARLRLIASLLGAAILAVVAALGYLARRSSSGWARLERVARVAAPLLVLWAIPPLCDGRSGAYDGREVELLLTAALVVVAVERCGRITLEALRDGRPSLPARPGRLDLSALAAVAVGLTYTVLASAASIRLHRKLLTSIYDLGLFENLLYNTLHGAHGIALTFPYFAVHAELILYPLLPFYWLVPRTETMLILQSAFLGLSTIPLFLLARHWLRNGWQAFVLTVAFALYPAVHGPNLYDFHFLTLSVFFILWAAYFLTVRRWRWFWVAVVLAMSCREDVALGLAAVGLALAALGHRRRVCLIVGVVGTLWFVTMKFLWMRSFGPATFAEYYAGLVAPGEAGFGSVLRTLISNPLFVVATVFTREKLIVALHLLVPLAFLPVRQRRTVPLLLPGFLVLGLSTSRAAILQLSFQYVCHFTPYLFIAAAVALAVRPQPRRWPALAAVLAGSIIACGQFGALRYDHVGSGFQTVSLAWTDADAEHYADMKALAAMIPPDASVSAGEHEGPHLARRRVLVTVKAGVQNAEYVFLGAPSLRWGGRAESVAALQHGSYGVVARRGRHILLRKGAPTADNATAIAWLTTVDAQP